MEIARAGKVWMECAEDDAFYTHSNHPDFAHEGIAYAWIDWDNEERRHGTYQFGNLQVGTATEAVQELWRLATGGER